jgi:hypothetical protein
MNHTKEIAVWSLVIKLAKHRLPRLTELVCWLREEDLRVRKQDPEQKSEQEPKSFTLQRYFKLQSLLPNKVPARKSGAKSNTASRRKRRFRTWVKKKMGAAVVISRPPS